MTVMEVVIIEWAIFASVVAVVVPIVTVIVKSTNIWSKLDLTVTNLSNVVTELSKVIKELQLGQNDITQRIIKIESMTDILEEREAKLELRVDKLDRSR